MKNLAILLVGLSVISCGKAEERVDASGGNLQLGLTGSWQGIRSDYSQTQLDTTDEMVALSFGDDGSFELEFINEDSALVKGSYSTLDEGKLFLNFQESNVSSFRVGGRPDIWTYEQIGDKLSLLQTSSGGSKSWSYSLRRTSGSSPNVDDPTGDKKIIKELQGVCSGVDSGRVIELQTLSSGDFVLRVQAPGQPMAVFHGSGAMTGQDSATYSIEKSTTVLGGEVVVRKLRENARTVSLAFDSRAPIEFECVDL